MLERHRKYIQVFAVFTLMLFLPSSVEAWNFIPAQIAFQAAEPSGALARLPSGSDQGQLDSGPAPTTERMVLARTSNLPEPFSLSNQIVSDTTIPPEPVFVAQSNTSAGRLLLTAQDLDNQGRSAEAALAYMEVLDKFPRTQESVLAFERLNEFSKMVIAGQIAPSEIEYFKRNLPTWEQCNSAQSKYILLGFDFTAVEAAKAAGDTAAAETLNRRVIGRSWTLMSEHPDDPLHTLILGHLVRSNLELGNGVAPKLGSRLQAFITDNPPSMATWNARAMLFRHGALLGPDASLGWLNAMNMLEEAEKIDVETACVDPGLYPSVRAWLGLFLAQKKFEAGRWDEAVSHCDTVLANSPDSYMPCWESAWLKARIIDRQSTDDLYQAILSYQECANRFASNDWVAPKALLGMASVYARATDYPYAITVYQKVISDYPDTEEAERARRMIEYVQNRLMGKQRLVYARNDDSGQQLAQACGPVALHRLLRLRALDSTVPELAYLAGTDDTGTTMQGLIDAAREKGLPLYGVRVATLDDLPTPFIAYVNDDHFVLVLERTNDVLTVQDRDTEPTLVSAEEFLKTWKGHALTTESPVRVAELLDTAALSRLVGGDGGGLGEVSAGPINPVDPNPRDPDDPFNDPRSNCPFGGTPDLMPAPHTIEHPSRLRGAYGLPRGDLLRAGTALRTGVQSDDVHLSVSALGNTISMFEIDIAFPTVGDLSLTYARHYKAPQGDLTLGNLNPYNGATASTIELERTMSRFSGRGWGHTFDMYIEASDDFTSLVYYNAFGQALKFSKTGINNGVDIYQRGGTWIERNQVTSAFTIKPSNGLTYYFTAAEIPTYQSNIWLSRLDSVADAAGNTVTLEYDDPTAEFGKLTRVNTPAGDDRYIEFLYSGDFIVSVALRGASGILKQVDYGYTLYPGDNGGAKCNPGPTVETHVALTSVQENGQPEMVQYSYANELVTIGGTCLCTFINLDGTISTDCWNLDQTRLYLSGVTDKRGNTWGMQYTYPNSGRWSSVTITQPGGQQTLYEYAFDSGGAWTDVTQLGHPSIQYVADSNGNLKERRFFVNATLYEAWVYGYADNGPTKRTLLTDVTTPESTSVYAKYVISGYGQPLSVENGGGAGPKRTWTYSVYLSDPNPLSCTNAVGVMTNCTYDANRRLIQVIHHEHAGTQGIRFAYGPMGELESVTDPKDNVWTYAYDARGNVTSVTSPAPFNAVTSFTYDDFGRVTSITDPRSNTTNISWWSKGKLASISQGFGSTIFSYDLSGNLEKVTDASGLETDFAYNSNNWLTSITTPSGGVDPSITTFAYGNFGLLGTVTDAEGKTTTFIYDDLGRVTDVWDPINPREFSYDGFGNLLSVEGANYFYDQYMRLTKIVDSIGKSVHYTYDKASKVTRVGAGSTGDIDPTDFIFDPVTALLSQVQYTNGTNVDSAFFTYDAGHLTRIRDWIDGVDGIQYAYDNMGRLNGVTDYDSSVLSYVYDAAGNVSSMNDYHGNTTSYTYDTRNLLSALTAPGNKTWAFSYNALGQPTQYTHPNGMTTEYGYDGLNQLAFIDHKDGAAVAQSFDYTYDKVGNITSVTHEDGSSWDYLYDGRYRLTSAVRSSIGNPAEYTETYTYDVWDNMASKTVTVSGQAPVVTTFFVNNGATELNSMFDGTTTTTFTYDDWGRQIAKADGTYTTTYSYRYGQMLATVANTDPSVPDVTYEYGGNGKRRSRTAGAEYTGYNWDGLSVASEEDLSGTLLKTYVGGLAEVTGSNPATGAYAYLTHDILGSTRGVFNPSKVMTNGFEFTPFGELYSQTGPDGITQLFTGHDYDADAGLNYTLFRYYAPDQARWLTKDPLGMIAGPNMYAYVYDNPINWVDPFGLARIKSADYIGREDRKPKKPPAKPSDSNNTRDSEKLRDKTDPVGGLIEGVLPPPGTSPILVPAAVDGLGKALKRLRDNEKFLEELEAPGAGRNRKEGEYGLPPVDDGADGEC